MSRHPFDFATGPSCPLFIAYEGRPSHDPDMDNRMTRLEVSVDHLRQDVNYLRKDVGDLHQDVGNLRNEMHQLHREARMEWRAELKEEIQSVRGDVRELRNELKGDIRQLQDRSRADFRLMFSALITVALGLSGLMAKGFHWI